MPSIQKMDPETNIAPEKVMVGRQAFPFGAIVA